MTLTELLTKANIVKVEQLIGKNTAGRVGGLFQDLINYFNGKTNTWTTVTDPVDDIQNTVKEGDRWITGGMEKIRVNGVWELISFWKLDELGNLYTDLNVYSTQGVSAYGAGTGGGGGGGVSVDVYNGLDSTDISLALSAAMGKQLNDTKLNSSAISAWALASVKPVYAISEITGLSTAIAGKADATHQHTISQITDFAHVHQWSAIENKPTWVALTTAPFTTALETKLNGIAAGAEVNVQSDWNATSGDAFIANKPTVFTPDTHDHYVSDILNFPTSMPASDVYAWAKAATKPAYTWSEIGSKPSVFTPDVHDHYVADILNFPASLPASDVSAWAKATTKPSYNFSEIGSRPTTLSGYGITDAAGLTAFNNHVSDGVKHLTSTERTNWNTAYTNYHTHSNKSYLDTVNQNLGTSYSPNFADTILSGITVTDKSVKNFINKFNSMFDTDVNGNIVAKTNLYSVGGISAYQSGAGISGLTLQGDMNANGKNITGASQIYAGNAYMGNVGINPSLQWSYDGDENTMVEYDLLTGEYKYAGNQVKYLNNILTVTGQVNATEFKFGNYSFKQDGSGRLGIYNGTTEIACFNTDGTYVNL